MDHQIRLDGWTVRELLDAPSGSRPRIYAYGKSPVDGSTRALKLTSIEYWQAMQDQGWEINDFWTTDATMPPIGRK